MDWKTIEITPEAYEKFETILEQLHQRGLLVAWGDSRRVNNKTVNFYKIQLNARFLDFVETVKQGARPENPVQQKMLDFAIAAGLDMVEPVTEVESDTQVETKVAYDYVAGMKRIAAAAKHEQRSRLLNSNEGRMVLEVSRELNLTEAEEVKLLSGFQLVQDARWFGLRREDYAVLREIESVIARTTAALPAVRAWMAETRNMVG